MGWTPVKLPGAKPTVAGLGPYREAAPSTDAAALVRPWRYTTTGRLGFFTLFAILWNGVCAIILSKESMHHDASMVLAALFPLLGIAFAYGVVAIWINHTRIDLDANTLSIRRGPLPWRGRLVTVTTSTLQQLYVEEYVSHEENDDPVKAFRVMARLTDGREVLIDRGMRIYDHARALEQWLEERLQIVDQPVAGEVPRSRSAPP